MIRAWVADAAGARETTAREAMAMHAEGRCGLWLDLCREDGPAAVRLLQGLNIHPLVLDTMISNLHRPKVDDYQRYLYLVLHSAVWAEERPRLQELDLLVGERFLVTYRESDERALDYSHEVLPRRPELLATRAAPLLHFILDGLVDQYLAIVDRIADDMDALEERAVSDPGVESGRGIMQLKRGVSALRRIVGPQRDTVLALTRDEFRAIPAEMRPYLRDVYDRMARIGDLVESFRDETASLLELQTAIASNRLNGVIKRLTVIATIGLPLTLVTGIYGMNFRFVEYEWTHPWLFVGALLVISAAVTWWFLKRRGWL